MIAAFRIRAGSRRSAEAQSVELPVEPIQDRFGLDGILGQVLSVREVEDGRYEAPIGLSTASVGAEPGQPLNTLFGVGEASIR